MSVWAIYARKSTEQTASGKPGSGARVQVLGCLLLALLLAGGCTTSSTAQSDPDRSPATKPDMKNYVQDSYQCVRESEQEIRLGQLPWSRQRDAQRLYEVCMSARGYEVQHR
jgi:hypothetical protein